MGIEPVPPTNGRLLIFGDSIASGLGVKERRYSRILASSLNLELIDLSHTGATILDSVALVSKCTPSADVALIAHGITEPIFRPNQKALLIFPKRWRKRGWMDPRPYYSRRRTRRLLEKIESGTRWRVKVAIIKLGLKHQLVEKRTYVDGVLQLGVNLQKSGTVPIVLGPPSIDDRYFPGSAFAQKEYRTALEAAGITVIDVASHLSRWQDYFDDHFHPNEKGHSKIARALLGEVKAAVLLKAQDKSSPSACEGE